MRLSYLQKQAAKELIATMLQKIKTDEKAAAVSFDELHSNVSGQARKLSEKVTQLHPARYGVNRSAVAPKETGNLMVVRGQSYTTADGRHKIPPRLVPRHTFRAFQAMNHSMKKDIGRQLVVQSGYRSPAYQLFVFLFQLKSNDWNVEKTLQTVALPGYSEHAAAQQQALDLRAASFVGPHNMYDFSRLPAYRWLNENAHEFGFTLSYPEDNDTGTRFEPWHWRHSPATF